MHWIGDTMNLFDMFSQTNKIWSTYPKICKPSSAYVNGSIYLYINSFIDVEGGNVIKLSLDDGYSALLLLQKYCAQKHFPQKVQLGLFQDSMTLTC